MACVHHPTKEDIGNGLHALGVTCANMEKEECQCHTTSAKTCMRQTWCVRIS